MLFTWSNIDGLARKMSLFAEQGKGLEWHAASSWSSNSVGVTAMPTAIVILMAIIFIASIVFFFHCRRVNRKAELAEAPKT